MTQADSKAKPAKRPKGEGQWALGYREPLNANEQSKKDDNPLNVRARIENIYAKGGFESIDKGDLRGRFRWWGLYTQRKPGYDGTWTGDDNTDMLEDEFFMLRVRCDGGALTAASLRTLGEISTEFGRDTADISDRQNIQYHWIRVEDMPEIWRPPRRGRPADHRGLRRLPPRRARLPAGRRIARRGDRRHACDRRDRQALHRQAGVLQPAAQVQDRDLGPAGRGARGQRRRVHRRQPSRARPRLRPVGRRRPVHQPDAGPARRRLGAARRGARRLGRRGQRVPRLRLPPTAGEGAAEVPDQGLGHRKVQGSSRRRVPEASAASTDPRPSR